MSEIPGPPPPDTSPCNPLPLPLPSTPSAPDLPSARTLRAWLPLYVKKSDAVVAHLNRILSTRSGTDTLLLTIQYSTLATGTLLSTLSLHRLHASALKLISLATSLPADTTIIIAPSAIAPPPRLLRLSQSLKALSALVSDFRIFVRLWGLLGLWKGAKALLELPRGDRVLATVAWAQVLVNVGFQALENGAYLAGKGVLGWDARTQKRAWVWSSRFWAAHVGLEFVRLGYLRVGGMQGKGKGKEGSVEVREEQRLWRRQLVSNLAYAPLTIHWSRESGLLSDFWIGVLGSTAGAVGLTELWKNTA